MIVRRKLCKQDHRQLMICSTLVNFKYHLQRASILDFRRSRYTMVPPPLILSRADPPPSYCPGSPCQVQHLPSQLLCFSASFSLASFFVPDHSLLVADLHSSAHAKVSVQPVSTVLSSRSNPRQYLRKPTCSSVEVWVCGAPLALRTRQL
jgi:hypothetical protein